MHEALIALVEQVTGFAVAGTNLSQRLFAFAEARTAALSLSCPAAYVEVLRQQVTSGDEWGRLIEVLSNGQTSFFRDREQFDALASFLRTLGRSAPLHLWSAGCSTGEEPYSLAILCADLGIRAQIVASDLNPVFLDRAGLGHFSSWALRNVGPEQRARWFESTEQGYRVAANLRQMVEWHRHNLVLDQPLQSKAPDGKWDLIVCRNVFIYFSRSCVAAVCRRFTSQLSGRGRLVVAASETLRGLAAPLVAEIRAGRVFYGVDRSPPDPIHRPEARKASRLAGQWPSPQRAERRPRIETPPPIAPPAGSSTRHPLLAATAMAGAGNVRPALELLESVREQIPDNLLLSLTVGHLHLRLHQIDDALTAYRAAQAIDSLSCEAHYFEGLAHRKSGDWSSAVDAFRRALFLAPTMWQAAYLLAGSFDRLGLANDAARERARTRQLLDQKALPVAFLSDRVFTDWFAVSEQEVRRLLKMTS